MYLHLLRKIYINILSYEVTSSWKSGAFLFILFQVVVFFGLVLCATHLSDITLRIAANILHTFFLFKGKVYWLLFPDKTLNTDTMVRLMLLHYILAFLILLFGIIHGIDMHYD
jgi:quinol-cytochrome oxidoreductase complex cytochrome b subunit